MRIPNFCLLITALCLSTAPALAQTELKLATIAQAGTPWVDQLEEWKDNLNNLSGGDLTLAIFPGGQLGNEADTFRQSQRGRIDIVGVSGALLAGQVKEVALMSTPFLFDDVDTIDCVYAGPIGDKLTDLIRQKDMELLYWSETGWNNVFAVDDLSDPATVEGYKARVAHHDVSRLLWGSLGANGVELPYLELPSALQTGMVKAGEATGLVYFAFGFDKVAPHFVQTKHSHYAGALLISQRSLGQLTPAQQQMLRDSVPDTAELRATVRAAEKILIQNYAENDGPVHDLSEEQRAEWKSRVEPNWPGFVAGLEGQAEEMWPELLAAKAACEE